MRGIGGRFLVLVSRTSPEDEGVRMRRVTGRESAGEGMWAKRVESSYGLGYERRRGIKGSRRAGM
jgi:hypothetical protein